MSRSRKNWRQEKQGCALEQRPAKFGEIVNAHGGAGRFEDHARTRTAQAQRPGNLLRARLVCHQHDPSRTPGQLHPRPDYLEAKDIAGLAALHGPAYSAAR